MEHLTSEEIYLIVNNDEFVNEYNLLDMYSVCERGANGSDQSCYSCVKKQKITKGNNIKKHKCLCEEQGHIVQEQPKQETAVRETL